MQPATTTRTIYPVGFLRLAIKAVTVFVIISVAIHNHGADPADTAVQTKATSPDPLILNKPLISPSATVPGPEPTDAAFAITVIGNSTAPEVLYLDEVSNEGVY